MLKIAELKNGFSVIVLEYGEKSPLENHGSFEIGADESGRAFYVHEIIARTYGTDSIISACARYRTANA